MMHDSRRSIWRFALVALALVVATVGCNLTANTSDPTPIPTRAFPTLTPTLFIPPTQFPIPTSTPIITPTLTLTVYACSPYTWWPVYTVRAGDTLGAIATRTNTNIQQLVQANCLQNPDSIYVGQVLYVPQLPPTPAPTTTPLPTITPDRDTPIFQYPLTANQHWVRNDGRAVTYYDSVRVTTGVVQNATLVRFYVNDPSGGQAAYIGQDTDPWDGAFVDYNFPAPGEYTFQAKAENEQMRVNSTPFTVIYDPSYTPPGQSQFNALTVAPTLGTSGGWTRLQAGTTVTIRWPDAPVGADSVVFMFTPTGTGTADLAHEIATDLNPADGARATWSVPGGISAHLQALANMPGGSVQQSQIMSVYAD